MLTCLLHGTVPTAMSAPAAPEPGVTIDAPVEPRAGTVELTGSVGAGPGETTTVLYVVDATRSTAQPTGSDCSGTGGVGPEDDLNGDGSVGDVLDCEIAGVQGLNRSLAGTTGVQAGLVAFANEAAVADLDPVGDLTFLPPGDTGGDSRPRLETVAASVQQNRIGLYDERDLGGTGAGTAFTNALKVALSTLGAAPAGPKQIMFISDGQSPVADAALDSLARSGARLRTFGVGSQASCARTASLYRMASATGEACTVTADPARLTAGLTGSQPDTVSSLTVTIGSVSVAASIDAVGKWRAPFTLGAGTYTATARATLTSGTVRIARRRFAVGPGSGAAPGTVAAGPGALRATALRVARPRPTRSVLPPRVTGRVGRLAGGFSPTRELARARVLLQARASAGDPWTTVARDRTDRRGRFDLRWRPRGRSTVLRVALRPPSGWAESSAAVREPAISACQVVRRGPRWSVTCRTTARPGSTVRLLDGPVLLDRSTVRGRTFRVDGRGPVRGARIELTGSTKARLAL